MLTPAPPNWMVSYNQMVDTYAMESDRAAAVLGGSFVDAMLEDVLTAFMVNDRSVREIFKGDRPFATFSAKISLAHAVGLLPPNLRADLDKIRRVRNHFAHHPEAVSFDGPPACDICGSLSIVDPKSAVALQSARRKSPRDQYLMTIAGLSVYFDRLLTALRTGQVVRSVAPAELRLFEEDGAVVEDRV